MASVTKSGNGWRAQVRVVGYPAEYASFPAGAKMKAWAWAVARERDLYARKRGDYPKHTLREALVKYRLEIAPTHKGARWEKTRLLAIERDPIADRLLADITDDDWAHWRERELKRKKKNGKPMAPASVARSLTVVGQVYEAARELWRWIPKNVMRDVSKPSVPTKRPKRVPAPVVTSMVASLGDSHKCREVALGFLIGCESAMRPWELLTLEKHQVNLDTRVVQLEDTKNGDDREVPLTEEAVAYFRELDAMNPGTAYFTVAKDSVPKLWADARARVPEAAGWHFRHSRRNGIKRLSEFLEIKDLALAIGHRDLNSLMIYYESTGQEMAAEIARKRPLPPPPATADAPPARSVPGEGTPPD